MKTQTHQFEVQAYDMSETDTLKTVAELQEATAALQQPAAVEDLPAERGLTSLAEAFSLAGL